MTDEAPAHYTINDLRGDLATTIRQLRDGDKNMTVDKAKAIGELAQTMINSAKVEVEMLKTVGRGRMKPTGFLSIEQQDTLDRQEAAPPRPVIEAPKPRPHIREAVGSGPRGRL